MYERKTLRWGKLRNCVFKPAFVYDNTFGRNDARTHTKQLILRHQSTRSWIPNSCSDLVTVSIHFRRRFRQAGEAVKKVEPLGWSIPLNSSHCAGDCTSCEPSIRSKFNDVAFDE